MGMNSQEVAYGFGQMGSMFGSTTAVLTPPEGMFIVAITSLHADTAFSSLVQASGEVQSIGTTASHNANAGSETAIKGSGSQVLAVGTPKIPLGATIYGKWTTVTGGASSKYIAYLGV
jgi:hypothetical protein